MAKKRLRPRDSIGQLAQRIATDLLTIHGGKKAHRVVLMDAANRDMGGWGPEPFAATIESHLRRAGVHIKE